MPLLEHARVEVYLPDLPSSEYESLLRSLEEEFTYTFGGASIVRGLEGSYLSEFGERIPDRINLVYSDLPVGPLDEFRHYCRLRWRVEESVNGDARGRNGLDCGRAGLSCDLDYLVAAEQALGADSP